MTLKDAIEIKHREAEQHPFMQRMYTGSLTSVEYANYLYQLFFIFGTLEYYTLPHFCMYRTWRIMEDIDELIDRKQLIICENTRYYINYLHTRTEDEIRAHIYLHYMALMYGGQIMQKKVPGAGSIYTFDNLSDAIQEVRRTQRDEWADEANMGLTHFITILDELHGYFTSARG
jgi:heme oxygenase